MNSVGGEQRPLEDILSRLGEMSRAPRSIDLNAPPPVPVSHESRSSALVEAAEVVDVVEAPPVMVDVTAPVAPTETVAAEVPSAAPPTLAPAAPIDEPLTIDLRTPPVTQTEPTQIVVDRAPSRVTDAAMPEAAGRYGRNAEVVFVPQRSATLPARVPLVPVSVREDTSTDVALPAESVRTGPNWIVIAVLILLAIALGAGLALLLR